MKEEQHVDAHWAVVAERAVAALGVLRGELIQVRESAGRYAILQAMLLTIERRGATPLLRCSAQIG